MRGRLIHKFDLYTSKYGNCEEFVSGFTNKQLLCFCRDTYILFCQLDWQLMKQLASSRSVSCDPVQLQEEFPRWLEKAASKVHGGVTLVIDSADRLQVQVTGRLQYQTNCWSGLKLIAKAAYYVKSSSFVWLTFQVLLVN